jgi:hypothetical protein
MISIESKVVATQHQVSCDLQGEAAILNLENGVYYGLNPVGARIWELVQEPRSVVEIRDTILEEYEVEEEQCQNDLLQLLREMETHGLIEVRDAKNP